MQPILHGRSSRLFEKCTVKHDYAAPSYVYPNAAHWNQIAEE